MSRSRRRYPPKLEPELLDHSSGQSSVAGGVARERSSDRVASATVADVSHVDQPATITLIDGSRFIFSRLADLHTTSDT